MGMDRSVSVEGGRIILSEENDGATYLRRGPEATERVVSLGELSGIPRLYAQAVDELKRSIPVEASSRQGRQSRVRSFSLSSARGVGALCTDCH